MKFYFLFGFDDNNTPRIRKKKCEWERERTRTKQNENRAYNTFDVMQSRWWCILNHNELGIFFLTCTVCQWDKYYGYIHSHLFIQRNENNVFMERREKNIQQELNWIELNCAHALQSNMHEKEKNFFFIYECIATILKWNYRSKWYCCIVLRIIIW